MFSANKYYALFLMDTNFHPSSDYSILNLPKISITLFEHKDSSGWGTLLYLQEDSSVFIIFIT